MLEDTTPKILDAEHLLESANDSARHFRNVYLAYLTVMIYIFIIVLSTDQELLFRADDKQLPLVHISVPIVAFFTWMPWALLILHFYSLIQVTFLSDKARLYRQEIKDHLETEDDTHKAKMLLAPVPLVHILVEEKAKLKHAMLYLIVFVSLAVFPLIVLIIAQMKFLPYQNEGITQAHRIAVMIDIGLLWCFGVHVFKSRREKWFKNIWKSVVRSITSIGYLKKWFKSIWHKVIIVITLATISVLTIIFIFGCLYIPNDKINTIPMISICPCNWGQIVEKKLNFPNYFDLRGFILVDKEPPPELLAVHIKEPPPELLAAHIKGQITIRTLIPRSPIWCQYAFPLDLKDRNFRKAKLQGAILCGAISPDANLTDADLSGAFLISADLSGADLSSADLSGAFLISADLSGADLSSADLSGADLTRAVLSSADLSSANLSSANLSGADLSGASLSSADLGWANLSWADLSEADLSKANLREAGLSSADLKRADLSSADLSSTDLSKANLREAGLSEADLSKANLREAGLSEADLSRAFLMSADLSKADLSKADLSKADLSRADLSRADLSWADLSETDLIAANLSKTDFSDAILDKAILDFTWVWKSSGLEKEANFPIGIPRDWIDTLKPEYLCPKSFDVSDFISIFEFRYINKDNEVEQEKLKDRAKGLIKKKCKPYNS